MSKILSDFEIQMDHPIQARRPDLVLIYNKKRTCQQVDFVIPIDHWVKIRDHKKIDKYLDLARELQKGQWYYFELEPLQS